MTDKQELTPKYWICESCANDRGMYLEVGWVGTVIEGYCGYCKCGPKTMIPQRDFVKRLDDDE